MLPDNTLSSPESDDPEDIMDKSGDRESFEK